MLFHGRFLFREKRRCGNPILTRVAECPPMAKSRLNLFQTAFRFPPPFQAAGNSAAEIQKTERLRYRSMCEVLNKHFGRESIISSGSLEQSRFRVLSACCRYTHDALIRLTTGNSVGEQVGALLFLFLQERKNDESYP